MNMCYLVIYRNCYFPPPRSLKPNFCASDLDPELKLRPSAIRTHSRGGVGGRCPTVTQTLSLDFMNVLTIASSGLARSEKGLSGGAKLKSPATSPVKTERGRKRTHDIAGLDSSPGSGDGDGEGIDERKRQPGVKRACNECRQQKVSVESEMQSPTLPP